MFRSFVPRCFFKNISQVSVRPRARVSILAQSHATSTYRILYSLVWLVRDCTAAANRGQLEVLQCLRANLEVLQKYVEGRGMKNVLGMSNPALKRQEEGTSSS